LKDVKNLMELRQCGVRTGRCEGDHEVQKFIIGELHGRRASRRASITDGEQNDNMPVDVARVTITALQSLLTH